MARKKMKRALLKEIKSQIVQTTQSMDGDDPFLCDNDLVGFDIHHDHATLYFADHNGCGVFCIVEIDTRYSKNVESKWMFFSQHKIELLQNGRAAIWRRNSERERQEEQERRLAS